ncbi:MAG TPA: hypothetical protein ENH28_00805 [Euryarchaeota archaeon]|nr:hypothetical protein [Euryarchaeota archaeon]
MKLVAMAPLYLRQYFLHSRKEALINKVAIYAYYSLVIGMFLSPADYLRERKEFVRFLVKYWEM